MLHHISFLTLANKKINLPRIKWLMILSQVMIVVFAGQWLMSQYREQQAQLKENLTEVFTHVQSRLSDSLVMTNVMDTAFTKKATFAGRAMECKKDTMKHLQLSAYGVHKLMGKVQTTPERQAYLYQLDSILFNDMFAAEMRKYGWDFSSEWINNSDSDKAKASAAIFINSNFFTDARGVVVKDYSSYIIGKMVPQGLFMLVMLAVTAVAFVVSYRSLKAQIKLSVMKDDFISNMSHELKTPIATVKVALEALNSYDIIDNPKLNREYLGMAASEMDRLELLATRVLNTSLLDSGKVYLQQESHNLEQLATEVVKAMQPRFEKAGATVSVDVKGSDFTVAIDKLHIQGVLVNLIDNSLKYGVKPVHINISLVENNGKVQLALTDNGPGIPEEYREKVFEKFFRVPNANRHNTKGHGLGLSYAAQVMRQHNGSINVKNLAQGGCMFTLSFQ